MKSDRISIKVFIIFGAIVGILCSLFFWPLMELLAPIIPELFAGCIGASLGCIVYVIYYSYIKNYG